MLYIALLNAISVRVFQNKMHISPTVFSVSLAEHLHSFKNVFYFNDKRISDDPGDNKGGIGQCKHLVEESKY